MLQSQEVESLLEKLPSCRLKPLYCPVDPENEPKLYRKQDFNHPIVIKNTAGEIEKVREEGKWFFLLQFLPLNYGLLLWNLSLLWKNMNFWNLFSTTNSR